MNVLDWTQAQIIFMSLIFMRMLAFFVSSAIFSAPQISPQLKVLLAVVMSFVFFPLLIGKHASAEIINAPFMMLTAKEIMIGLCLGFLTRMFFYAVSMAGEIISVSTGLGSAQIFNPAMNMQGSVMEMFHSTLATLLFLTLNGHHYLIEALTQSFQLFPVIGTNFTFNHFQDLALIGEHVFIMGIKMSAPIMAAGLLSNLGMAIIGRAVPQVNVLVTSFSVTLIISLGLMVVTLPLLFGQMEGIMAWNFELLFDFLKKI
ncbi:MAG: flagellar biosynthetic protein FliR [Pseudobdellovibrionaceae bacterium]